MIDYAQLVIVMNISRITFLSQFVVPMMEQEKITVKKEQVRKVGPVTKTEKSDNDTRKYDETHDPMYFYELEKAKSAYKRKI